MHLGAAYPSQLLMKKPQPCGGAFSWASSEVPYFDSASGVIVMSRLWLTRTP